MQVRRRSPGKVPLYYAKFSNGIMQEFDIRSGQVTEIAHHPTYLLYNYYFSPDGQWIVFEARNQPDRNRFYIMPFRSRNTSPQSQWIQVTDGAYWDDKPRWSPDGTVLHFVSYRDGFLCIWAIRLDPATKRPKGEPFAIYHSHGARLSLSNSGLARNYIPVAADKLVFPLGERHGNIWLAELGTR
jgi:WD40-like Beta Propeller Repeat